MAKWGFLKNIVNIDRFFAGAGAEGPAPKEEAKEEKKLVQAEKSDKPEQKPESRENGDKITSEEVGGGNALDKK